MYRPQEPSEGLKGAQAAAAVGAGDQEAMAISGVPWTEPCQGLDRRWWVQEE